MQPKAPKGNMVISPIVTSLFGNGTKARVIQWLYTQSDPQESYPPRALARLAGIPYGSVHKTLSELLKARLVSAEQSPRGVEYRAPFGDARLKHLFLLLRQDSELVAAMRTKLRRFKSIEYACVFGSFARGQAHEKSDVDVLILGASAEEEWDIRTALQEVALKFSHEISPQFLKTKEFIADLDKGEAVSRSILANPRIELIGEAPWQT